MLGQKDLSKGCRRRCAWQQQQNLFDWTNALHIWRDRWSEMHDLGLLLNPSIDPRDNPFCPRVDVQADLSVGHELSDKVPGDAGGYRKPPFDRTVWGGGDRP